MKKVMIAAVMCCSMNAIFAQSVSTPLTEGTWTEKQNGISEIKWTFSSTGVFNNIMFWNSATIGGLLRKGHFDYDKHSGDMKLVFQKTASLLNDGEPVSTDDNKTEVWTIKSISANEILIKRPVKYDFEKKLDSYDGKNVDVSLIRVSIQVQNPMGNAAAKL